MNTNSCNCAVSDDPLIASGLKALGHPVRLQLLMELRQAKNHCCGDLCRCFSYSQSTISQHLGVLSDAGLITATQDGNRTRFSINHASFSNLIDALQLLASTEETASA